MDINKISDSLRKGSKILAGQTAAQKNIALSAVIESIKNNKSKILEANKIDVEHSRNKGVSESLIDRLSLDDKNTLINETSKATAWIRKKILSIKGDPHEKHSKDFTLRESRAV